VATGYERDDEAQRLLDAGAVGFLQKPFEQTRLAQALRRVLDTPPTTGRS
jgi:CheY-like chemotaxis protein